MEAWDRQETRYHVTGEINQEYTNILENLLCPNRWLPDYIKQLNSVIYLPKICIISYENKKVLDNQVM